MNDDKKAQIVTETINVSMSATNSPMKASIKAPQKEFTNHEALKQSSIKHPQNKLLDECKQQTNEARNNNKPTASATVNDSDDDDSVFINDNKSKKTTNKPENTTKHSKNDGTSSVMLQNAKQSSSLNAKTVAPAPAQNHLNSRDLNLQSETVVVR